MALSPESFEHFDPSRSALLLMDFQVAMASAVDANDVVHNAAKVKQAARAIGMHVVYIRVALTDSDYAGVGRLNKVFAPMAVARLFSETDPSTAIVAELLPEAGDLVVTKNRFNAFTGSNLEQLLRARSVDTLVLCGISTSGVVLATQRHASDEDYRVIVIEDGCVDPEPRLHESLIAHYFPGQAEVISAAVFVAAAEQVSAADSGLSTTIAGRE